MRNNPGSVHKGRAGQGRACGSAGITHQPRRATPARLDCPLARSDGITCSRPNPNIPHTRTSYGVRPGVGILRERRQRSSVDAAEVAGQAEPNRPGSPETKPQGCACALSRRHTRPGEGLETWPCMNAQHRIFRRRPPSARRVRAGLVISGDHMHFSTGLVRAGCEAARDRRLYSGQGYLSYPNILANSTRGKQTGYLRKNKPTWVFWTMT